MEARNQKSPSLDQSHSVGRTTVPPGALKGEYIPNVFQVWRLPALPGLWPHHLAFGSPQPLSPLSPSICYRILVKAFGLHPHNPCLSHLEILNHICQGLFSHKYIHTYSYRFPGLEGKPIRRGLLFRLSHLTTCQVKNGWQRQRPEAVKLVRKAPSTSLGSKEGEVN